MPAIRVIISGRVQGVSYRAWTVKTASQLGITGWVRNRADGTVEAAFYGNESIIQSMIESCKKGPMLARVDKIEQFAHNEPVTENSFILKPTV